ncbi:TetR family transcriptional regulator [Rathayibacter sp. VKM Ac-2803]|uniref:TetR/AcrR family transcriptional regulator n=1 Tax=unclassified Rathayibacter TaxID=2609250 RepID=UPI001356A813|nr:MULTISPECIES: TetR/AcrR family transcriptional regulator [unclassified Rathayibacter]MWV48687.1 TetR family transcriptional regulator [Rathayibacter sp. VKM Ac-2803]MWV60817.1 TetR family transcriptional regulator [Rathayibacter sp. VKM Ac-2754]
MPEAPGDRPRGARSDARRNRTHILGVAEEYFTEHGVTGSLDAIAKRAGVGAGTLYRHFPTREALLAELLAARDETLVAQRDRLRDPSVGSADALNGWLDAVAEWAGAFDGLPEPLRAATSSTSSPLAMTCQGFVTTTEEFLGAAQREGTAREDVRARDLFLAALATSWVRGAALADDSSGAALSALIRNGWESTPPSRPSGDAGRTITDIEGQQT